MPEQIEGIPKYDLTPRSEIPKSPESMPRLEIKTGFDESMGKFFASANSITAHGNNIEEAVGQLVFDLAQVPDSFISIRNPDTNQVEGGGNSASS